MSVSYSVQPKFCGFFSRTQASITCRGVSVHLSLPAIQPPGTALPLHSTQPLLSCTLSLPQRQMHVPHSCSGAPQRCQGCRALV